MKTEISKGCPPTEPLDLILAETLGKLGVRLSSVIEFPNYPAVPSVLQIRLEEMQSIIYTA